MLRSTSHPALSRPHRPAQKGGVGVDGLYYSAGKARRPFPTACDFCEWGAAAGSCATTSQTILVQTALRVHQKQPLLLVATRV